MWEEAITSINSYVRSLKDEGVSADVTVAAFDSFYNWNSVSSTFRSVDTLDFTVLRNEVDVKDFKEILFNEVSPRGNTPLYDATARLLNLADKRAAKKTVIIIMTDGEENASKDYSLTAIKDRVASCTHRGWEVVFLGADFDVETVARSYGIGTEKLFRNVSSDKLRDGMRFYASASAQYATGKLGASGIDTTQVKSNIEGKVA